MCILFLPKFTNRMVFTKMESTLNTFKQLRRNAFIACGNVSVYDNIIHDIEALLHEDDERYMRDALIETMRQEYENIDKAAWYEEHFDTWIPMPERQDCEWFSLEDRLRYAQCRVEMFDHLERSFKQRMFPNLAERLEFF